MFGMLGMFDPQGTGGAGGGSTFSPSQLFASGEQGVWYDPSDFSTMFQDSAGTTPVTAIEQPVGLLLDKSKNGVGANGAFRWNLLTYTEQFDNVAWTATAGATKTTNSITDIASTSVHGIYATVTLIAAASYRISFRVKKGTVRYITIGFYNNTTLNCGAGFDLDTGTPTGTGAIGLGYSASNASMVDVGGGEYVCSVDCVQPSTTNYPTLLHRSTAYTSGSIAESYLGVITNTTTLYTASLTTAANASLPYQRITDTWYSTIPGNHAFQSTTTARPILRNRYNLLTYTERFDNAYWYKATTNVSVTANVAATTDPLGGNTADKLIATNTIGVHYTLANYPSGFQLSGQFTLSVYAKKAEYNWVRMLLGGAGGLNNSCYFNLTTGIWDTVGAGYVASSETLANGWFRLIITGAVNGNVVPLIALANADGAESFAGDGTSGIYVWGASLTVANEGTIPYQWVTTGTAGGYNTDTALFKPFLAFDGTDDVLVTSNIDFSSTDQMSVFAGVRKLSDAKVGVVAELSADIAANNGTFLLSAPNSAAANYNYSSKGTTQVDNTITTYTSPITNVITGLSDISASVNIVRANGGASTYVSSTQGTGNYGTYPLYIGWRGGVTASTQFTGRIYSLIIRNALTESTLLGQTETWVNGKTGAY